MCERWAIVTTQAQRESYAVEQMDKRGLISFFPKYEQSKVIRGRHVRKRVPMFSRYVFVLVQEAWRSLLSIPGIQGLLVTAESNPAFISGDNIEGLREFCRLKSFEPEFEIGELISIDSGPFAGFKGLYDGCVGDNANAVEIELFGRKVRVVLMRGALSHCR